MSPAPGVGFSRLQGEIASRGWCALCLETATRMVVGPFWYGVPGEKLPWPRLLSKPFRADTPHKRQNWSTSARGHGLTFVNA